MTVFLIFGLLILASLSTFIYFSLNDEKIDQSSNGGKSQNSDIKNNEEKENQNIKTSDNTISTDTEKQTDEEETKSEELATFISESHETFNQLTNYDNYKNIDWLNYEQVGNQMIEQMNHLESRAVVPFDMTFDFDRMKQLIQIGMKNHDATTAIYIHRILQDLDVEYNHYEQSKYGFSNYDKGGANQQTVDQYIEGHKEFLNQ